MSFGLSVYRLSTPALSSILGSKSAAKLAETESKFEHLLLDDEDPMNEAEGDTDQISLREALADLVREAPEALRSGFMLKHVRALEILCQAAGTQLEQDFPIDDKSIRVDEVLQARGVSDLVSFRNLTEGAPPFGFPNLKGIPGISYLDEACVRKAHEQLTPLDLMGLPAPVAFNLIKLYGWLGAAREANQGIAAFYG